MSVRRLRIRHVGLYVSHSSSVSRQSETFPLEKLDTLGTIDEIQIKCQANIFKSHNLFKRSVQLYDMRYVCFAINMAAEREFALMQRI